MEIGLLYHCSVELSDINLTDNQLRLSLQTIAMKQGDSQVSKYQ